MCDEPARGQSSRYLTDPKVSCPPSGCALLSGVKYHCRVQTQRAQRGGLSRHSSGQGSRNLPPSPPHSPGGGLRSWDSGLSPVTDCSLKYPLLDPVYSERGLAETLMGILQGPRSFGGLGVAPRMWGRGEGCLFLHPHRKFCSPLLPSGWSWLLCSQLLSQRPRAEGASEDISGLPADSPLPTPFSLIPPLSRREAALAEG